MAINQTNIVLDTCTKTVNAVTRILDALNELEALQEQLSAANIDLTKFTADIEAASGIEHCEATTYANILSAFAPAVPTSLKALYSGTPTQQAWAGFMKARK